MFSTIAVQIAQSASFGLRYAMQGVVFYGALSAILWLLGFGGAATVPLMIGGQS